MIRRDALSPVNLPGTLARQACHMNSRSSARLLLFVQYIRHEIYIPDMRMLERAFALCKGLDEEFAGFGCGGYSAHRTLARDHRSPAGLRARHRPKGPQDGCFKSRA